MEKTKQRKKQRKRDKMKIHSNNNFINPKSSIEWDYSSRQSQDSACSYNSPIGEDKVDRFVLEL